MPVLPRLTKQAFALSLSLAFSIGCDPNLVGDGDGDTSDPGDGDGDTLQDPLDIETATTLPDPEGIAAGETEPLKLDWLVAGGENAGRFATSNQCALCHSNNDAATAMRDARGNEIAPFNLWQGTMMANAARDPFFRAVVSAEVARTPAAQNVIEAECLKCHAPMANVTARDAGGLPSMALLKGDGGQTIKNFALDGVSCTVCHQILEDNLGTEESWSGGYEIGENRLIYGPHQNPAPGPMQNHVAYTPTYGPYVTQSKHCAVCHTLFTEAIDENANAIPGAKFPEQTPYLEWQNSIYNNEGGGDGKTCQTCHMPITDEAGNPIETRIARSPPGGDFNIPERSPFGRHIFVGANTVIPQIMRDNRSTLFPLGNEASLNATINMALDRLGNETAAVTLQNVAVDEGKLNFDVQMLSEVGHKFPTGFPARRAWLEVVVLDADDNLIFSSGTFDSEGRLTDHRGEVLDIEKAGGPIEPHRDVISRPDEVQIYESVMSDEHGEPTFSLMRATVHMKDNRVLPLGYSEGHSNHARTKPRGVEGDPDFRAGEDFVSYEIALGNKTPARVEVRVWYQTLGSRFMRELFQQDTPEVAAFRNMYERANHLPVLVAETSTNL